MDLTRGLTPERFVRRRGTSHCGTIRFMTTCAALTCAGRVLLPTGEGGPREARARQGEASRKGRMRAGMRNVFDQPALTRPFGPPSPGGRGTCSATTGLTFRVRPECGNEIQNSGRKVESA